MDAPAVREHPGAGRYLLGGSDLADTTPYSTDSPTPAAEPHVLTVLEPPPTRRRRSVWAEIFAAARQHPDAWVRVTRPLSESTARQMASDVRSAHRRPPTKRPKGLLDGERWDATWGHVDGEFFVWIKLEAPDVGVGD